MRLCIPAKGTDLDSQVEEHFAKAEYFIMIDTDTMAFYGVLNTARTAEGWSGVQAAELVLEHAPEAVLAGTIGHQAFGALKLGYVQVYEGASGTDTVRKAVEKLKAGTYVVSSEPTGGIWRR